MEKKRGNKPSDESSEDSLSSSDSSSDEEEVRGFGSFGRRLLIAGTIWKMQEFLRWYYFTSTRLSVDLVPCVKMLTLDETNPFVFHYLLKSGIPPQHIPTRFPRGRVAPRCDLLLFDSLAACSLCPWGAWAGPVFVSPLQLLRSNDDSNFARVRRLRRASTTTWNTKT